MKILVIAEKPSVGKDIARVLGCGGGAKGYMEGSRYVVTWALGHLVTLADPEIYGDQYKSWKLEDLPIIPKKPELVVIPQSAKQYKTVKEQLHRKDISEIVIATDAGREGELVARWILEKANCRKPCKRLWISSVTDKAIKEGFAKLREGKEYQNLYFSAQARAEADWLVGINATRALTAKFNAQLSCGRVQTPTLAIINSREEEIRQFRPRDYYKVTFQSRGVVFTYTDRGGGVRIFDKAEADRIIEESKKSVIQIVDINKSYKKAYAPHLYDLTTLQREANKLFGYSAKETLSIMQRLYEQHKVLTYPRTDSQFIPRDVVATIPDRLKAVRVGDYKKYAATILSAGVKTNQSFVNDSKVSDHHAIIPTEQPVNLQDLSMQERKVFDLVVKRFLAVLMPPFEYEQTTIQAKAGGYSYTAKGKTIIAQGYREIYGNDPDDDTEAELKEQSLPPLAKGQALEAPNFRQVKEQTKPPSPFNEGTLLAAMENPAKYMEDSGNAALAKTLGETGGLGTVATRADIIEKLFSSFLIEKRGTLIYMTPKGRQLLKLAPEDLRSPDLTAQWEQKLNRIAKGAFSKQHFLEEIQRYTREIIQEIKQSGEQYRHDNITGQHCPECNKLLLEVKGKKGKLLVCQDRECGYRKTLERNTNARCPVCHKRMTLTGEGEKATFNCICGHRERLKAFEERRKTESGALNKKEAQRYIEKLNQENDSANTPLAGVLAGLKIDRK